MKKLLLMTVVACVAMSANAQWVDDPAANTFVHEGQSEYNEIYQSRCPNGDFFIQFCNFVGGDWNPKLMYVTKEGVPMWDEPVFMGQSGSTMSTGVSMTATTDCCAVSHFAREEGGYGPYAYKVNAQGEIVWGPVKTAELPDGAYQCRTEVVADENGGVWVSTTDFANAIHVRHIAADGTMGDDIQVQLGALGGVQKMVSSNDGGVLVAYQSYDAAQGWTMYDETIKVTKIDASGNIVNTQTMMNTTSIQGWKFMSIIPDGMGGGWCWIEHCGGDVDAFNIYAMHFSAEGNCTTYASHPLGVQVSPTDEYYYRIQGAGTCDVVTGDLILAFLETDADYQAYNSMRVVRISQSGELLNGAGGTVIIPVTEANIGQFRVACAPDRSITILYCYADSYNDGVIKALAVDPGMSVLWAKDFNTNQCLPESKEIAEGAYEYADGQYVVFFQDGRNEVNGLYGQNIQPDGTMGPVVENPFLAPTNLTGEYVWNDDNTYGALISWTPATGNEISFDVYKGVTTTEFELIGNTTETEYFDDMTGEEGGYLYQVIAVYEGGESGPATTADGDTYVIINITDVNENAETEFSVYQDGGNIIIKGVDFENADIYNVSGQIVKHVGSNSNVIDASDLNAGMYFVNVKTDGRTVSRKVVVR
ncbi:MAG: T9SS type A sorting domain-containing protein [Bacteroidales bacterium]|nr:T9SS type A sorting domain-containing protein [Bacteroidales bacterium]